MANTDKPKGFIPVGMLDGSEIPVKRFPANSVGSNIAVGDLVSAQSGGDLDLSSAGDGNAVVGVVVGIVDENKIPAGHPNSTISTKYLPSGDTGYLDVALMVPNAVFRCQADSGTTLAATNLFNAADHVATACDTTTAASQQELDSSGASTGTAQFKIIDVVDEPGNAWGEHVDLLVVPCESWWFGGLNEAGSATRGGI